MNVLVFRTNINSGQRLHKAACRLCKLRGICRWSVDMEDRDCVLRIEAPEDLLIPLDEQVVIRLLTKAGIACEVLS
ncbi:MULTISPECIES: hypothetical protein [Larkinella]|uniref:Uncharacterized protein n=1 Tax=Larkinella humicola TaxID=2607654 RepID=A0A5N1J5M3_9BACT|nr:hypothetical protein [Larkinella humicola]KAA9345493.1 hypothetical protein F0P93_30040 [Larkinella humicola]